MTHAVLAAPLPLSASPAVNAEGAEDGVWAQLTPGRAVSGLDGRAWTADPAEIVAAHAERGLDLPVDIEHASHIKAPAGEAAPAQGWVTRLEARGDQLWGLIRWTEDGARAVASRAYRYLSPAFFHDASGAVRRLASVGLTNRPNLRLPALNQETHMDWTPLLAALGLPATAGPAEAVAAAQKLALNREQPDPAKFAPRADLELALNRAAEAEGKLAERAAADWKAAVEAAVDAAIAAGKVAPASRDYHLATCREQADLDRFTAMVAASPAIVGGAKPAPKPAGDALALNAEERIVCEQLRIPTEAFLDLKKAS